MIIGERNRDLCAPIGRTDGEPAERISVYPLLFRIGSFEVTSFGAMLAVAALVGIWLFGRELARSGLPRDTIDAAIAGVIGGLVGAKLLWTLEFFGEQPFTNLLFSRGGFSWFGGFIGGVGTGLWMLRRRRAPIVRALARRRRPWRSAMRSDGSDVSWWATITGGQVTCHGPWPSRRDCHLPTSRSIQPSCTRQSVSQSSRGR